MLASDSLRGIWSVGRRPDVTPRRVHIVSNLAEGLAFGSLGHHGTRDVDADPSAITHGIEQDGSVIPHLLHVATGVRRVPPLSAAAEAGHPLQKILISDRESVGLLDPRRGLVELLGPAVFGRPSQQRIVGGTLANT